MSFSLCILPTLKFHVCHCPICYNLCFRLQFWLVYPITYCPLKSNSNVSLNSRAAKKTKFLFNGKFRFLNVLYHSASKPSVNITEFPAKWNYLLRCLLAYWTAEVLGSHLGKLHGKPASHPGSWAAHLPASWGASSQLAGRQETRQAGCLVSMTRCDGIGTYSQNVLITLNQHLMMEKCSVENF